MKVYKNGNNHLIITFEEDTYAHISIFTSTTGEEYIEYHKKCYPKFLLKLENEILFNDLDEKLKQKLINYFNSSLSKAKKKVNIFNEAVNLCLSAPI